MKKALMFLLCGSLLLAPVSKITYAADTPPVEETKEETRLEELEKKEIEKSLNEAEKKELEYLRKEAEIKGKIDAFEKKEKEDSITEAEKKELADLKVELEKARLAHLEWKDSSKLITDEEKKELAAIRLAAKKARYEELKGKDKLTSGEEKEFEELKKIFEEEKEDTNQNVSSTVSPVPAGNWKKKPKVKRDRLLEKDGISEKVGNGDTVFEDDKVCTVDWYAETVQDSDLSGTNGIIYSVKNIDQGILEIHQKKENDSLVNWTAALATSRSLKNGKLYLEFADPNWKPIKDSFAILKLDSDAKVSPFTEITGAKDTKNTSELYGKGNYITEYKPKWEEKNGITTLTINLEELKGNSSLAFELKGYYTHTLENILEEDSFTEQYSDLAKLSSEFIDPKDGNKHGRTWLGAAFTADIENCTEMSVINQNSNSNSTNTSRLSGSKGIPKTGVESISMIPSIALLGAGAFIMMKKKRK
ncbi:MAG: hypothetical protein Q4G11_02290 [Gallicola sp.]|nr:hypothetical protein [Gallicola sp.]